MDCEVAYLSVQLSFISGSFVSQKDAFVENLMVNFNCFATT